MDALAADGITAWQAPRLDLSNGHDHAERTVDANQVDRLLAPTESRQHLKANAMPIKVRSWAGDVAGSTQLERDYGISRSTLHGWQKQSRVVSLLAGARKHVFPLAQFIDGRPIEGLADVVAATGSPRTAWAWLVKPHPSLGARAPLDRLKAGEVSAVAAIARREFAQT